MLDLDLDHLDRQVAGDDDLRRDLLSLFDRQCERLLPECLAGEGRQDAAHTLTGSARAVGAERVASLAAALETALAAGRQQEVDASCRALPDAIGAVRRAVAAVLAGGRSHPG